MNDLRYACRMVLKHRGFSFVAVLLLALGIGANTTMFTLLDGFLFKPLPVDRPAQLRQLYLHDSHRPDSYRNFSWNEYQVLREQRALFSGLFAHVMTAVGLAENDNTRRAFADLVSADYFSTLGVRLFRGREFVPEEATRPVAIVSYSFWKRHGGGPDLVGQSLRLNGRIFTVVGIAPPHFYGTLPMIAPDFWLPLGLFDSIKSELFSKEAGTLTSPATHELTLIARLAPGRNDRTLNAQLAVLADRLKASTGEALEMRVGPLPRFIGDASPQDSKGPRTFTITVMALTGIVLLVTCFNLASMLLARGAARQREIAVRLALGAGRRRIFRQLLLEQIVLAAIAAAAALFAGIWTSNLMVKNLAARTPFSFAVDTAPDVRVLLVTTVFSVAAIFLSGIAPAWNLTRTEILSGLKDRDAHSKKGWWRKLGFGETLVGAQLALSLALLTAAGLFIHGAVNALSARPGFQTENRILIEVDGSLANYDEARGRSVYRQAVEALKQLPDALNSSLAATVPFGATHLAKHVQSRPSGGTEQPTFVHLNAVGSEYFETLALPLLRGRTFSAVEDDSTNVVIIDDLLASKLWPDDNPVGGQIYFMEPTNQRHDHAVETWRQTGGALTIIGVVPWTRDNLSGEKPKPHIYIPFGAAYQSSAFIHVRLRPNSSAGGQPRLIAAIRAQLKRVDPNMPILSIQPLERFFKESPVLWVFETGAFLFSCFGVLAALVAGSGLFGLMSCLVARRRKEFGIRIALGAMKRHILGLVLRRGLRLLGMGLAWGAFFSYAIGQALRNLLFEVSATDPAVFVLAPLLLSAAGLLACWFPARAALRSNLMSSLGCD